MDSLHCTTLQSLARRLLQPDTDTPIRHYLNRQKSPMQSDNYFYLQLHFNGTRGLLCFRMVKIWKTTCLISITTRCSRGTTCYECYVYDLGNSAFECKLYQLESIAQSLSFTAQLVCRLFHDNSTRLLSVCPCVCHICALPQMAYNISSFFTAYEPIILASSHQIWTRSPLQTLISI